MSFFSSAKRFLICSIAVYVILKALFLSGFVNQYIQQIILFSFIAVLTSLGLNVIYGYTGQFSLGHAGFYGIGAYTAAYMGALFNVESIFSFLPILALGGAAAGLVGYVVGVPILRLRDDFLAIATWASASWCGCSSTIRIGSRKCSAARADSSAYRKSSTWRSLSSPWFFSSS